MNFKEWDTVLVTGVIVSEKDQPKVEALKGVVATVYTEDHDDYDYFKVWPVDDADPKLPKGHDGKLWFSRTHEDTVVKVIRSG